MKTTSLASMEMFILANFHEWFIYPFAILALLNFILNLVSVYLGWFKRRNHGEMLEHILHHVCDDELEFEDFEDIGIGIPEDIEQEVSEWMEYCQQHIMEHGRLPTQKEIEKHFNYQSANDKAWKEWEEQP